MEHVEGKQFSPEERFFTRIEKRSDLWRSLVEDSSLEREEKEQFIQIIEKQKKVALDPNYCTVDAWAYGIINQILILKDALKETKSAEIGKEAEALFLNLKDDVWDFVWKEVK